MIKRTKIEKEIVKKVEPACGYCGLCSWCVCEDTCKPL